MMASGSHRLAVMLVAMTLLGAACSQGSIRVGGKTPTATPPAMPTVQAEPMPIAGGTQLPDGPLIHVFAPGPDGAKLPISGSPFTGLNADPSAIGDFKGFTAAAALVGEVTGNDGKRYLMETDVRAFKGNYRDPSGAEHNGVFAFI